MGKKVFLGVAAIVKNEAPYLLEWIAHHRLMGVEKFFIADNESSDGTTQLLRDLAKTGWVVHHPFPTPAGSMPQLPAYQMLLERHRDEVEWLAFIDADEFIWPTDQDLADGPDFPAFLRSMQRTHPNLGAMALNWATYGSSDHVFYEAQPIVQRFTEHAPQDHFLNKHFKSVVKTSAARRFTCSHNAIIDDASVCLHTDGAAKVPAPEMQNHAVSKHSLSQHTSWAHFRLNHYVIKSYDEFIQKKQSRGRAFLGDPLNNQFFLNHNLRGASTSPSPAYLAEVRNELNLIANQISCSFQLSLHPTPTDVAARNWQVPVVGSIEAILPQNGKHAVHGWALAWGLSPIRSLHWVDANGQEHPADDILSIARTDVLVHYPGAHLHCGFVAHFTYIPQSICDINFLALTWEGLHTVRIDIGAFATQKLNL